MLSVRKRKASNCEENNGMKVPLCLTQPTILVGIRIRELGRKGGGTRSKDLIKGEKRISFSTFSMAVIHETTNL